MDMDEATNDRIRDQLRREGIKLWLPPFSDENGKSYLKELAATLATKLILPESDVLANLEALQQKALQNLKERSEFQNTGIANIKIIPSGRDNQPVNVKLPLTETGRHLKDKASEALQVLSDRMKLISKGKLLKNDEPLDSQGISNGAHVMCLMISGSAEELAEFDKRAKSIDVTKRDIELIAKREEEDAGAYLEITDQTGKPLKMPAHERKALVMAMSFHEKGRAAIKKTDFETALALFLEAEKEFHQCNSNLLDQVDNYGLLSLDIAWCYLNLRSISQLPDAEVRLQRCEESFAKSYGTNLERLVTLKGTAGNEQALFLRLHLLRAIVFFHRGKIMEARVLLNQVGEELKMLKVDDEKLSQLASLGYTAGESLLALRASRGELELAVTVIENKRAERKQRKEDEKKEKQLEKERRTLGKCKNGGWIEPQFHKSLMSMGYSYYTAKWALAQTDNRISDAIALIQEHSDQMPFTDFTIQQVMSLGHTMEQAIQSLEQHGGDFQKASFALASSADTAMPSTSRKREYSENEKKAFSRLREGVDHSDESHLDLKLDLEEVFYEKYKKLIEELKQKEPTM